jgi:hypothetical protein
MLGMLHTVEVLGMLHTVKMLGMLNTFMHVVGYKNENKD